MPENCMRNTGADYNAKEMWPQNATELSPRDYNVIGNVIPF